MDNRDGPWSVSVAETPYDARSYSLYIKTPTHNLTLTRTALELVELDHKLRQAYPILKFPQLPITPETLPLPPKRKSTFLNTLSRLASPASAKSQRQNSTGPHPIMATIEANDPFSSFSSSNGDLLDTTAAANTAPSALSTSIAAYLTTLSNIPVLRQDRYWKRFVRVRTDDLESVRVERAIKRVRSDLAAHGSTKQNALKGPSAEPSENGSIHQPEEQDNGDIAESMAVPEVPAPEVEKEIYQSSDPLKGEESRPTDSADSTDEMPPSRPDGADNSGSVPDTGDFVSPASEPTDDIANQEDTLLPTPIAADLPRMHRSKSADPHKFCRLPRYTSSVPSQSETGDESSSSAPKNGQPRRSSARKKRSTSAAVPKEPKKSQRKVVIHDFEMMRVLGKGCAGKVLLVRHKQTSDLFALKAITKRHVLAHQELQHTLTEQAVLKKMAADSRDPFVVKLWWSFHDKENLFLVMDFHPGGDLATQLARWGHLGRDRARFYAAEIVEGVEGLHAAGVIYRDLKPENILIGGDGHIVLTDFGLSKAFPRRNQSSSAFMSHSNGGEFYSSVPGPPQPVTPPWMKPDRTGEVALGWPGHPIGHPDSTSTFCGTAEYLAPEVIQGLLYSYEVDWWSFGTMLYEMLTGITPFWADNHSDMYVRVLEDELKFPEDRAIDQDTKSLIRGLLQRVPSLRICEPRIKRHPYFSMIDWSHVYYKRYIPPYIPPIDPSNASDTQNFDDTFLDMEPVLDEFIEAEATDTDQEPQSDTDRTDGEEEMTTTPSQSRSSSIRPLPHPSLDNDVDVFDGYSFKGRHSMLIDGYDDDEEEEEEDSFGEEEEEESIEEEDNLSILETLEREAAQFGDRKSEVVGDEERDGDGDVLVKDGGLLEEDVVEAEPKTPEARPAATLRPVEEVLVPPVAEEVVAPVVDEVVAPVAQEVVVPAVEEVVPPVVAVVEEVVAPIVEVAPPVAVLSPVAEEVSTPDVKEAVPPLAEVAPLVSEVEETVTEATKMEESQAEPKVEEEEEKVLPASRLSVEEHEVVEPIPVVSPNEPNGDIVPAKEVNGVLVQSNGRITPPPKIPARQTVGNRAGRNRREKSGVPALDRYLSDGAGEVTEAERDEDDDWDFVEADGEDRNGAKGPSLFARGVVDRYRLAVFRKASTPSSRSGLRSVSGMSNASGATVVTDVTESPSPSQRRGRTPGLTFRKNPRQFLKPKSPPSSFSAKTARSLSQSASTSRILSAASSSTVGGSLLSASQSVGSTFALSPSLKSKESATSVGAHSQSSDQSATGTSPVFVDAADTIRGFSQSMTMGTEHKVKNKKLRRYKHNAEKVFSLFSSPRQAS
jgi:serine/threonine protein kinase